MTRRTLMIAIFAAALLACAIAAQADTGSGFAFTGAIYTPAALPNTYTEARHDRLLWYQLVSVPSSPDQSLQPLALMPLTCRAVEARAGSWPTGVDRLCHSLPFYDASGFPNSQHPLEAGDHLVIGIYDPNTLLSSPTYPVKFVSINVQASSANPLNPSPLRPTISTPAAAAAAPPPPEQPVPPRPATPANFYYLPWNQTLAGDTIPTVTIAALYGAKNPAADSSLKANDESVTLLSVTLPQVHALFGYNLSFGLAASTIHESSFSRVANTRPCTSTETPGPAAGCGTYTDVANSASAVQPAVFFTAYLPQKFDAESAWNPKELIWPIAPTVGISLTQPSTDFFVGNSSEIRRGVQIVYGCHIAKTNYLVAGVEDPTSSSASVIRQRTQYGFFAGVSFNLNFIQSLFAGGGK